jgi:hypothetical protein
MAVRTAPNAYTLAGRTAAAKAIAAIDRLLILDGVWSSAIGDLNPDDAAAIASQRNEFTELMDDFQGALAETIEQIRDLRGVLGGTEDGDVEAAMGAFGEQSPEFATALDRVFTQQINEVGVRGAAIFACDYLIEQQEETRQALRTKYDTLMEGRLPNPGLPKAVRCALYLAGLGAAGAAVIASHGALAMIGAAGGPATSAVLSWEKSGCIESWQAITGGRLG